MGGCISSRLEDQPIRGCSTSTLRWTLLSIQISVHDDSHLRINQEDAFSSNLYNIPCIAMEYQLWIIEASHTLLIKDVNNLDEKNTRASFFTDRNIRVSKYKVAAQPYSYLIMFSGSVQNAT